MKENKMFLNVEFSFVYGHVIYSKSMPINIGIDLEYLNF